MSKSYRRKWLHQGSIIRQRGEAFQVEINQNGQRHRTSLDSLAEAKAYIEQKKIELANQGLAAFALSDKQRLEAVEAFKELGSVPLSAAVTFYLRHHRPVGGTRTVQQLYDAYLDAKTKSGRRPDTLADIRNRVGKLAVAFGTRPVHTLTTAELTGWLDKQRYQGINRANYRRAFSGFFAYAIKQGLLEFNPASGIEKVQMDETLPEIFSVAEAERVLNATTAVYPRLLPATALGFFAGLRTAELEKLEWGAIDFEGKLLTVGPAIAKKRRQRHVTLSDNLLAWLAPYRKATGRVSPPPAVVIRWRPRIMKKAKLASWPRNGLRHSFASYHLAKHQNISETAALLGHTGPDVLYNHYRNLVKPADAAAYWSLVPKRMGKVVAVPADVFQQTA